MFLLEHVYRLDCSTNSLFFSYRLSKYSKILYIYYVARQQLSLIILAECISPWIERFQCFHSLCRALTPALYLRRTSPFLQHGTFIVFLCRSQPSTVPRHWTTAKATLRPIGPLWVLDRIPFCLSWSSRRSMSWPLTHQTLLMAPLTRASSTTSSQLTWPLTKRYDKGFIHYLFIII